MRGGRSRGQAGWGKVATRLSEEQSWVRASGFGPVPSTALEGWCEFFQNRGQEVKSRQGEGSTSGKTIKANYWGRINEMWPSLNAQHLTRIQ